MFEGIKSIPTTEGTAWTAEDQDGLTTHAGNFTPDHHMVAFLPEGSEPAVVHKVRYDQAAH